VRVTYRLEEVGGESLSALLAEFGVLEAHAVV
jgi:hypothetical protein